MYIPTKEQAEQIKHEFGLPTFVTDAVVLRENAKTMLSAFKNLNLKIFYAIKANYNPHIVGVLEDAGIYGIDAVSPNEVRFALSLGYKPEEIIFTPSNPSTEEMKMVGELGVLQNLGSLSELERYAELFPGTRVSIRISPEVGAGEFKQIETGWKHTKFGVLGSDLQEAQEICKKHNVTITGIHSHIGSGFYDALTFQKSVEAVLGIVKEIDTVETADFGGGFGVRYKPDETPIDLALFARSIEEPLETFEKETGRKLEMRIEPGKFLVSNSTVLLGEVTTIKEKGDTTFVGLNTGFHHLIRPAMYDAYHHVANVSNPDGPKKRVSVAGNVCETCDVFNGDIEVAEPQEGDILAILVAGGYGTAMSSNYNMRDSAAEVLVDGSEVKLTKRAGTLDDITTLFT